MRLLVFGSRGWPYPQKVYELLTLTWAESKVRGDDIMYIIAGGARGVDTWAAEWANSMQDATGDVTLQVFPADWKTHGKKAGWVRNNQMVTEGQPSHALGFWDGTSRGTKMMIDILASVKIPRRVITPDMVIPLRWTS